MKADSKPKLRKSGGIWGALGGGAKGMGTSIASLGVLGHCKVVEVAEEVAENKGVRLLGVAVPLLQGVEVDSSLQVVCCPACPVASTLMEMATNSRHTTEAIGHWFQTHCLLNKSLPLIFSIFLGAFRQESELFDTPLYFSKRMVPRDCLPKLKRCRKPRPMCRFMSKLICHSARVSLDRMPAKASLPLGNCSRHTPSDSSSQVT